MKNHYSMVYKIPLKSPENPHERIPMDQKYQCTGHVQNTHCDGTNLQRSCDIWGPFTTSFKKILWIHICIYNMKIYNKYI